jgi:D-alanyl-D-alanine carboxypeptidase
MNKLATTRQVVATLLVVLASFATVSAAEPKSAQQIAKEADTYMQAQVGANNFSGSVLISRDGKVLFEKGYGYANAEWKISNTPTTKFRIGSITKQFTATLIMQLQQEGKLSVNDPACKFLDSCPDTWKPITIHHLLSHTGGVKSYTEVRSTSDMTITRKPEEIMALVRDMPLEFTPGDRYKYSNSGYFLLGMIIEKVAGKPYEAVLQEKIFKPLGMNDSGYDRADTVLPQRAMGYRITQDAQLAHSLYVDMSWPYSAGALYSTVQDLDKWNRALYTEAVLPQSVLATMFTSVKNNYGYGWQLIPFTMSYDKKALGHGGGINGFAAFIVRYIDDKTCIVVLSNLVTSNAGGIANALSAITFGHTYITPKIRTAIKLDPKVLESLVGEYRFAPTFTLKVTTENGRFFTQGTNQGRLETYPESETEFFLKAVDAQLTFVKDANGKATKVILHQNGRELTGTRIE